MHVGSGWLLLLFLLSFIVFAAVTFVFQYYLSEALQLKAHVQGVDGRKTLGLRQGVESASKGR